MNSPISVNTDNAVAMISLQRPAERNALSLDMIDALIAACDAVAADTSIRVVVLQSDAPVFCAGHDLKELTTHRQAPDGGRAFFQTTFSRCSDLMRRLVELPQPVVAAIEGVATAAGCQLVASCDLGIAGASARFATPGVSIGLFCSTPAVALTRAVAPKHAMEMLLTGDLIDAETAARIALINRVVPAGQALRAARELARHIASKSPTALSIGKRAVLAQRLLSLEEAYAHAGKVMVENLLLPDAVEGIGAFLAKRMPQWPG